MSALQATASVWDEPAATARSSNRFLYKRHEPETTVLYGIVRHHLEPFLAHARESYQRPLPNYVVRELRNYLRCGILANGFSRVQCPQCHHEFLVAHSCKGRGLCPSCSSRRMTATAAHITTKVLPDVPVRQWVLSVPWEIRGLLAAKATVLSSVLRVFLSAIAGWYKRQAGEAGIVDPQPGAIAFVQRFGGALNLHVHYHVVCVDGVFAKTDAGAVLFRAARPPSQLDIGMVAAEVGRRVKNMLRRQGLIVDEPGEGRADEAATSAIDACMQTALASGSFERIEDGTEQPPISIDEARFDHRRKSPWSAEADGFSVHAGVWIAASDAAGREKLLRYCARPTLSLERLGVLPDGRVTYRVKYPRKGGRTHLVMDPMTFMARVAALIPPPRHALVRYSGVLAPASKWRLLVVPAAGGGSGCDHVQPQGEAGNRETTPAPPTRKLTEPPAPENNAPRATASVEPASAPMPAAPYPLVHVDGGDPKVVETADPRPGRFRGRRSTPYIDWATLMRRSMGIDVLECPKCQGRMRPIADITEREVVEKILRHLNLPLAPELLSDGATAAYDITGAPLLEDGWRPGHATGGRGPPAEWDGVDAPAPDG